MESRVRNTKNKAEEKMIVN